MIVAEGLTRSGIVEDASFTLAPGELVVLLGPNGAGKTTLLRMALGLLAADRGGATISGDDARRLPAMERARRVSYLPQSRPLAWPAKVRDVVALGRFAHGAAPAHLGEADRVAVGHALAACDLQPLADRAADTLSGGELARVHLARALAAEAPLIVADEPVASLDPRHQHRVLGLLRDFVARGGGALAVLHDLSLAARYADRLVWMKQGRIVASGSVTETMTVEQIADIYGVTARIDGPDVIVDGIAAG
ncbi:ABC transporter ATP-binding protein [Sphingomonas cannabina]|uniref:ABC transporter ATP-binding protein n=1 Tax=Sphingomonas cannabina TaxID=2899123 RepID=UPI001F3B0382|nr:ABC transporter ATP-binding protein [Sphingomonas cannabina]UIJ47160.1 ABC transporter ATP-binding protein [Sphingomonas cannabina]